MAIKGAPGWWALHHWEPPIPPRKLVIKHTFKSSQSLENEEIILSSDSEGDQPDKDKEDIELINVDGNVNVMESHSETEQFEDLIVDESDGIEYQEDPENIETISAAVDIETQTQGPILPSADLKQQLL